MAEKIRGLWEGKQRTSLLEECQDHSPEWAISLCWNSGRPGSYTSQGKTLASREQHIKKSQESRRLPWSLTNVHELSKARQKFTRHFQDFFCYFLTALAALEICSLIS